MISDGKTILWGCHHVCDPVLTDMPSRSIQTVAMTANYTRNFKRLHLKLCGTILIILYYKRSFSKNLKKWPSVSDGACKHILLMPDLFFHELFFFHMWPIILMNLFSEVIIDVGLTSPLKIQKYIHILGFK